MLSLLRDRRLLGLLATSFLGLGTSCSSRGESVDQSSSADTRGPVFLAALGTGSEAQANAYYARFVPNFRPGRFTFTEWKARAFESAQIVRTFYRNANELGFWRDMTCSQIVKRGLGGCAVTNYRNETDPERGVPNLGTVAMDISAEGVTRFYAFDAEGTLVPKVALDSEGEKFVPDVCVNCHSGVTYTIDSSIDLGSIFREFEPSLLDVPRQSTRDDLDAALFLLNKIVIGANGAIRRSAEGGPKSVDHAAGRLIEYLRSIYPDPIGSVHSLSVHDPAHVPPSWRTGSPERRKTNEDLWTQVVNPSCMPCHRANAFDWSDYPTFVAMLARGGLKHVIDPSQTATGTRMPQAEITANRLVHDAAATDAIERWSRVADLTDHVVLFGGARTSAGRPDRRTWILDETGWTAKDIPGPPPRHSAAMAALRGRAVLFGGEAISPLGDTWEWDGIAWHNAPVSGPSPRADHAMATRDHQRVVLFGGFHVGTALRDTWEWDGTSWSLKAENAGPPLSDTCCGGLKAASFRDKVLVIGHGVFNEGDTDISRHVWQWDGQTWTRLPDHPYVGMPTGFVGTDEFVLLIGGAGSDDTNVAFAWDGEQWRRAPAPPGPHRQGLWVQGTALFGNRPVVLGPPRFLAEEEGRTFRWNGAAWDKVSGPNPIVKFDASMVAIP